MKLLTKIGNIINAHEPIIIHGCNAQGKMGSGVAKAIREKWPECYKTYRTEYEAHGLMLGELVWYQDPSGKIIGNAITQQLYGYDNNKYVDYDAIRSVMKHTNYFAYNRNVPAVALPAIGAGLGGGDWSIIKEIIEESFVDVQPILYVLECDRELYT